MLPSWSKLKATGSEGRWPSTRPPELEGFICRLCGERPILGVFSCVYVCCIEGLELLDADKTGYGFFMFDGTEKMPDRLWPELFRVDRFW